MSATGDRRRPGRVTHLLRDLTGRNDRVFVETLAGQVDATLEGAQIVIEACRGGHTPDLERRVDEAESAGDDRRAALVAELSAALTTPIDREDLFRLSRSIDDVLDNLRDFAREVELFAPESPAIFAPVVEALVEGLHALRTGIDDLVAGPHRVTAATKAAKKHGNALRRSYQHALARLFTGDEVTMEVLKQRDLLRRLDVAGLRLGEAADALADGVMKRGY